VRPVSGNQLFVLAVVFYFALVSSALALLFLPGLRARAGLTLARLLGSSQGAVRAALGRGRQGWQQASTPVGDGANRLAGALKRHWRWVLAGLVVLTAGPLLAWLLRQANSFEGFDHTARHEVDTHVAGLLAGEQLVPPPALPPELFLTREVEQAYPLAMGASRQWELLDGDFRQRLLVVFQLMRERHGYEMALIEGYRSPERQNQLAALGKQVTQVGAFGSYHQFGLAADCGFLRNGRLVISEQDPWAARGYELYGEVARSTGMVWGGGWRSLKDLGHVELRRPGVLRSE
jgi:peptidoglycan L-alanyl-D-glutamate endopeptidase CwlK